MSYQPTGFNRLGRISGVCVTACCILLVCAQPSVADTEWLFEGSSSGWEAVADCELTAGDASMMIRSTGADPHLSAKAELPAGWNKVTIKARFRGRASGQVFWAGASQSFNEATAGEFNVQGGGLDGGWTSIVAYFQASEPVTEIRLDPMNRAGRMEIASIVVTQDEPPRQSATPVDSIRLLPDFQAELLYSVPTREQGSWVCLTVDDQGRLITSDQYGKLYRITPSSIGDEASETAIEIINADIGMAQGLLYAFDSLYVVVNGNAGEGSGLYRLQDTNNDDQFDRIRRLRKFEGGGEHGPHAVILSPDGESLYICGGNHTNIPDPEQSLVPRNWEEDQVLPRMWDAGGHAVNKMAPGGWICRTDPEGRAFELVSAGYRNEYDIAFNSAGELFTYDADMEWDIGTPWYRPTRVCHATDGSEFGWRSGTGKWPVSYPDALPAVVDIGPGSPTGIVFGYGAKFPAKYQNALFIADWSYGIIYAVHMEEDGASYKGVAEQFCSAAALQVADMVVNPKDGALYFVIGGRRTQSGLYRVTYQGDESTEPAPALALNADAQLRKVLEQHFQVEDPATMKEALALAWENLGHHDRHVRYAARMVLEHLPVERWADDAVQQDDPIASMHAIVSLARCGDKSHQAAAIAALGKVDWDQLNPEQQITLIRAYSLVLIRLGATTDATKEAIIEHLGNAYPSGTSEVDQELCRVMIAIEAPDTAAKTLELLAAAATQEEEIHYALCLRALKSGWTLDQRREYFEWFNRAAALRGGNSFTGFLSNIRKEAIAALSDEESTELKTVIDALPQPIDVIAQLKERPLVKEWKVQDLLPVVEEKLVNRDLEHGKQIFSEATCFKCHRFMGQGGIVGPDLTAAGRRFNRLNLLEALIEPSKVISDQYQATMFITEDGKQVVGRVVNLNGDNYMVQEDMLDPGRLTRVNRFEIEDMQASTLSMMPNGLLDTFTEDEILDLIAYLRSGTIDEDVEAREINPQQAQRSTRPNVVMIISDDQAWTDYSFMGHEAIQTPNLDRLARESVTFRRGYVPTSLCRPSLVTLATGLYPHQHKITGNDPAIPSGISGNPRRDADYLGKCEELISNIDRCVTLPEALSEVGYVSMQTGKWWEGGFTRGGFDAGMTHGDPKRGGRHGDEGLKIGRQGMEPIFDFIDAAGEQPFFVWYAPFLPHTPHNPPQRLIDKYQAEGRPVQLAKYYAMCEWFDETCGELLDYLDDTGHSKNTVVIYVTDNGWIQRTPQSELPEGWSKSFAPRSKQSPYEGGTRTPIMIRWPGRFEPLDDDTTLISSIDLVPTILSLAGAESPDGLPGENLVPVCHGRPLARKAIFGEGFAHDVADLNDPSQSLLYRWSINGKWKLLTFHDGKVGRYPLVHARDTLAPELYDLSADPHETNNLASEHPDVVKEMTTMINQWWNPEQN